MKRFVVASVLVLSVTAVFAQGNPIAERKATLKGFGEAARGPTQMLRAAPFDLAVVQASLQTFIDGSKKLPALFPDDSKTGGDTAASPKIWTEKAKFEALFEKLGADATAAKTTIKDEASFKANYAKVLGNCKACHDDYRLAK